MPWTSGGGWTDPWLPLTDRSRNVEGQRRDDRSTLYFTRDLIDLRRRRDDLRVGAYEEIEAPPGAWAWQRGARTVVALNLGDAPVVRGEISGSIPLATDRARDGAAVGTLELAPGEGAIVDVDQSSSESSDSV